MSSLAALPHWKNGSFAWKPPLREAAEDLKARLGAVDSEAFDRAVLVEAHRRMETFLQGVEAYRAHPYRRALPPPPVIWQEGTTRLLDYSAPGARGAPVLVIPSLINRSYILDLTARRSFMRYLGDSGVPAYLVDWDAPGPEERGFGLDDYVGGRLCRMLAVLAEIGGAVNLVGYCMGGLLALALAAVRPALVQGLVLMATPWDFHADPGPGRMLGGLCPFLEDAARVSDGLPVDLLQALFAGIDPGGIERKFRSFAEMDGRSAKARDFVALEDWLNDGVPLVRRVAEECFRGWYVENRPMRGSWEIAGMPVRPEQVAKPALALIPQADRIVPPASALALADRLPRGQRRILSSGHIGMVAGRSAKTNVYRYITKWLIHLAEL